MLEPLDHVISGRFGHTAHADSPAIDAAAPGLRIAAVDVRREAARVRFTLLLSYGFPDVYFYAFADIEKAISVELADAGSGRGAVFSLLDPSTNYLDLPIEGFTPPAADAQSVAFLRAHTSVPLDVAIADGPGLFVRAVLQAHRSNTLCIPAAEAP